MSTTLKERWPDCDIRHLVYEDMDLFVVFVDSELDVDWETTSKWDERQPTNMQELNAIINDAATVECTPCEHLRENIRLKFKRLVGEAIARSLSHDYDNAKRMLIAAKDFIDARIREKSRAWYLEASVVIAGSECLVGAILWLLREQVSGLVGNNMISLLLSAVAGGCGALLSIILRIGKFELDSASGKGLHNLEAGSRIVAGNLSAILVYFGIKSGLILPSLANVPELIWGLLLLAFIAGSSERLAPSIIARFAYSANPDDSSTSKPSLLDKHNPGGIS
ncbi:hypothetical protein KKH27_08075 [bacterium]|nr:hypothetical protein [bacterium]MBU1983282.1 hypothetical protein [bacterium]